MAKVTKTGRAVAGSSTCRPCAGCRTICANWITSDIVAGVDAGGLRNSGFAGLCRLGRPAAADRHIRLSAGRAGLRAAGLFASVGRRTDLRDLVDDRSNNCANGRRRCGALHRDCRPRGVYRGVPLFCRLAAAPQRDRAPHQRQYFGRIQSRRRTDDHHDTVAGSVRRSRRRTKFPGARLPVGRSARPNPLPCACIGRHGDRCAAARRTAVTGQADCTRRRRAGDHSRDSVRTFRIRCRHDRVGAARLAIAVMGGASVARCRRNFPAGCRMPSACLCRERVRGARLRGQARL